MRSHSVGYGRLEWRLYGNYKSDELTKQRLYLGTYGKDCMGIHQAQLQILHTKLA